MHILDTSKKSRLLVFLGLNLELVLLLPVARIMQWELWVFDNSTSPFQYRLLKLAASRGWIKRITDHKFLPSKLTHTTAIDLADKLLDKLKYSQPIILAGHLYQHQDVITIFKRKLAENLCFLLLINDYLRRVNDHERTTIVLQNKYSKYLGFFTKIFDPKINFVYVISWSKFTVLLKFWKVIIFYALHLWLRKAYKEDKKKETYCLGISVPFPWAAKFKGGRDFTFLVDNKLILKSDVVFLIEYTEQEDFYKYYGSAGYTLVDTRPISSFGDIRRASKLSASSDSALLLKIILCEKSFFHDYEALSTLLLTRLNWAIVFARIPFRKYVYFNKENESQLALNVLFRSQNIQTHAYSQFIGGPYQASGRRSNFDHTNIHWSFLNPDYFYLNNNAMLDSMRLHRQGGVNHRVIGNIFSEKINEIRRNSSLVRKLEKKYLKCVATMTVAIFDTTYIPSEKVYSNYIESVSFLEDIIRLADHYSDVQFIFKPSKSDEYFLDRNRYWACETGTNILAARKRLGEQGNVRLCKDSDDVVDIISLSDLVITNCFSSPTADAILAEVPGFWYQSKTDVSYAAYTEIEKLVVCGFPGLVARVDEIRCNGYPIKFKNNPRFDYLVGELGTQALTELRKELISS